MYMFSSGSNLRDSKPEFKDDGMNCVLVLFIKNKNRNCVLVLK
jgi:hypothetical protein